MTKTFTIESDTQAGKSTERCALLEVTVSVECSDSDGADATTVVEMIENLDTGSIVLWENLDKRDQTKIERGMDHVAAEHGYEAYLQWLERRGDRAYDMWKEGQE